MLHRLDRSCLVENDAYCELQAHGACKRRENPASSTISVFCRPMRSCGAVLLQIKLTIIFMPTERVLYSLRFSPSSFDKLFCRVAETPPLRASGE